MVFDGEDCIIFVWSDFNRKIYEYEIVFDIFILLILLLILEKLVKWNCFFVKIFRLWLLIIYVMLMK